MERSRADLDGQTFDLLVCGGGIYGAWIAYDAALRGLKVIVVDKGDWASATSSGSSKLIHGGLRYLQSLQLGLVRKSLQEREMLFRLAPHRVQPLRFGIPVYGKNPVGKFRLAAGLWAYDLLAGISRTSQRHGRYDSTSFSKKFPVLSSNDLQGGFDYLDGQTDDARCVLEIIAGAQKQSAVCLNYCEVMGISEDDNNRILGAELEDHVTGKKFSISAKTTVSVTGQWAENLIKTGQNYYRLSKGVHLIMPSLGLSDALLLFARSDGRVFFIIPWYGHSLLGTTDDEYDGDVEDVKVEAHEIDYLLGSANDYLGSKPWGNRDILGSFAAVRVLKANSSTSSYLSSRDWELEELDNGLLLSVGGKFSSARQDAAGLVDQVCSRLSVNRSCQTLYRAFPWAPETFTDWREKTLEEGSSFGFDSDTIHCLIFRHGNRVQDIFRLAEREDFLKQKIFPDLPFLLADLVLCAETEMVVHLEDLLRRRMPLLIFRQMTRVELDSLTRTIGPFINWDKDRIEQEVTTLADRWQIH